MTCKRCQERGKTWEGSDPVCAFGESVFFSGNWNCATMNALRDLAEESQIYNDDQYGAMLPVWEGRYLVMSWYKHRGRTEGAWIVYESKIRPLNLKDAELILESKTIFGAEGISK